MEKPESAQKRAQKAGIANAGYDNSDERHGSQEVRPPPGILSPAVSLAPHRFSPRV